MFVAINFQSICYIIYASGHSIDLSSNFLSEEESHESENSSDSDETKDVFEYLNQINEHSSVVIHSLSYYNLSKLKYLTSNYSGTLYSPPDISLL